MSEAKKPRSKKAKIQQLVNSDLFRSIAIVSVILNILFLASLFVLSSTDTFDRGFFNAARRQYCRNIDGVRERADELASEKAAVKEWQVTCISKEFKPYYNEAIEKFNAQYPNH